MLRLNIGTQPKVGGDLVQQVSDLRPVDGDPFGQAGGSPGGMYQTRKPGEKPPAASGPGDPSTIFSVQGKNWGSNTPPAQPPPTAPHEPTYRPVDSDPFQDALRSKFSPVYVAGGAAGGGTADATAIPQPGTPVPTEQTQIINRGNPSFWDALWDRNAVFDPVSYTTPTPAIPGQGPQLDGPAIPPGPSSEVPDFSAEFDQSYIPPNASEGPSQKWERITRDKIEAARNTINAAPIGTGGTPIKGDGTTVGKQGPGSVSYDPDSGDVYGGQASNKALMAASLIPLTSGENLQKRIMIYSADLGVPPDRFFTDNQGNVKWVDQRGQVFNVAPTIEGGSWKAPVDLAGRVFTQGASEFGQGAVNVAGAVGGMVGGSGPAAKLAAGMAGAGAAAFGTDIARQVAGNIAAERAGYVRPPEFDKDGKPIPSRLGADILDIDWYNATGQAIQNMGFEALARTLPILLNGVLPAGLFGSNPYRLNRQEITDLAFLLEHDAKTGGHILKRAQAMHELGLPLTPMDLLRMTDGKGMTAGYAEAHGRLRQSFEQLEKTIANRRGRVGAGATEWMQNFYRERQETLFPRAIETMLEKIHPSPPGGFSPKEGFVQFQDAADAIVRKLEGARLDAGHKAGWDSAFDLDLRVDTSSVRDAITKRLNVAAGRSRDELTDIMKELVDGGLPVTNMERLHNIRLDIRSRIDVLKGQTKRTAADSTALKHLEEANELLTAQLRRNPLYQAGDNAFTAAGEGLDSARSGLMQLLSDDAKFQEQLGGALAEAGPTKIAAARALFKKFGLEDVWNAHTRAYLQHGLTVAGKKGGPIGEGLYREVAHSPKLREGLKEMAPDAHTGDLLDELLTAGHAMDVNAADRVAGTGVAINTSRLSKSGNRNTEAFQAVVSPLRYGLGRAFTGGPFKDLYRNAGSMKTAVEHTRGAAASYNNMRTTAVPLAGASGEALERAIYLGADPANEYTDMVPRLSPDWLAKLAIPYIHSPPQLDPTAPDLKAPPRPPWNPPALPTAAQLGLGGLYYGLTRKP